MEHQDAHLRQATSESSYTTPQTNTFTPKCQNFLTKHSRYKPATRTAHSTIHTTRNARIFPVQEVSVVHYQRHLLSTFTFWETSRKETTKTNRKKEKKTEMKKWKNVVANSNTWQISELIGFCFSQILPSFYADPCASGRRLQGKKKQNPATDLTR